MFTLDKAKVILGDVRERFASGAKSANKAYVALGGTLPDIEDDEPVWTKDGQPDRNVRRNHNAAYAALRVDNLRAKKMEMAAVAYGGIIWNKKTPYGNCTEMACVAAYRVAEKYRDARKVLISIGATGTSGDHVFCVVGATDGWEKIGEPPAECEAIIIDPWANICCRAPQYPGLFRAKMASWLGKGKRIYTKKGWIDSGEVYQDGFLLSKIDLMNARVSPVSALI